MFEGTIDLSDILTVVRQHAVLPDLLDVNANLLETGIIDSAQFLDIVFALEGASGKEIDFMQVDAASMTSLRGLLDVFRS